MLPFESGVSQGPPAPQRFTVSFYLTAMLFIVFDIEIVFLYPLAVVLEELGWFALIELLVFVAILASPTSTSGARERSSGGSVKRRRVSDRPLAKAGLQSERLLWPTKGRL